MNSQQIRAALSKRAANLPHPLTTLGFAVWQMKPTPRAHARAQRLLHSLVRAGVNQNPLTPELRLVRRHLLICPPCAKMYLALLDLAQRDAQGELPPPPLVAPADLSFLEELHDD